MATDGGPLTKLVDHPCLTDAGKTGSDRGCLDASCFGEGSRFLLEDFMSLRIL